MWFGIIDHYLDRRPHAFGREFDEQRAATTDPRSESAVSSATEYANESQPLR
ncbi:MULTISPECIES: hypothetical protein [Halococcus]|uniref:hypothetical protein n=1 Tax=Halococcus TaxID=2249 RepID=UPI000B11E370|nr:MULTISPECIES: hypothetical protein [Halococcus]